MEEYEKSQEEIKKMSKLKIVYAGTPEFAAISLKALHAAGHEIVLVMTQPDRPAGRGLKLQPSPVKQLAEQLNLEVIQPTSLKLDGKYSEEAELARLKFETLDFDVMVVAAYGLILPQWALDIAQSNHRVGCLNIHASLLPRWRGAAPIQRAIWSGDLKTGNCIMKMEAGLDTGPVILCDELPIRSFDTTATLHDRLAQQGARLIVEALDAYVLNGELPCTPQPETGVTYAQKILKEESLIDWTKSAVWIDRQIRALNPMPGAHTKLGGDILKAWFSELLTSPEQTLTAEGVTPGQVIDISELGIAVACGDGALRLIEVQKAGGKKISAAVFAKQQGIKVGDLLG